MATELKSKLSTCNSDFCAELVNTINKAIEVKITRLKNKDKFWLTMPPTDPLSSTDFTLEKGRRMESMCGDIVGAVLEKKEVLLVSDREGEIYDFEELVENFLKEEEIKRKKEEQKSSLDDYF